MNPGSPWWLRHAWPVQQAVLTVWQMLVRPADEQSSRAMFTSLWQYANADSLQTNLQVYHLCLKTTQPVTQLFGQLDKLIPSPGCQDKKNSLSYHVHWGMTGWVGPCLGVKGSVVQSMSSWTSSGPFVFLIKHQYLKSGIGCYTEPVEEALGLPLRLYRDFPSLQLCKISNSKPSSFPDVLWCLFIPPLKKKKKIHHEERQHECYRDSSAVFPREGSGFKSVHARNLRKYISQTSCGFNYSLLPQISPLSTWCIS